MDRDQALELVKKYIKNNNLINHMIAAECVMRHFATRFNEDPDEWGLAGLVHDIDVEMTKEHPELHGIKSAEILRENGFSEKIISAVGNHPKELPEGDNMSRMLYSADQITGLIVAGALIHPDKKLSSIDFNSILKRFNEKRFAAGVNREKIKAIELMGIELEEFIREALVAMSRISQIIGL
ncbi:MAG TPA: HDIG domain-containing protein [Candidatus Wallbacteria bacterium]|nr:HDIG domain-containing protein [Candidatus Wallbacteria bacterium]